MSRISGAKGGLLLRVIDFMGRRRFGKKLEPPAVMAHQPWLLAGYAAFEFALERQTRLAPGLKALAEIQAATCVGCPF